MLEIQVVRRSREGVVIPVARSNTPALVKSVVDQILAEMTKWSFGDEMLDKLARRERTALAVVLEEEGMFDGDQ